MWDVLQQVWSSGDNYNVTVLLMQGLLQGVWSSDDFYEGTVPGHKHIPCWFIPSPESSILVLLNFAAELEHELFFTQL